MKNSNSLSLPAEHAHRHTFHACPPRIYWDSDIFTTWVGNCRAEGKKDYHLYHSMLKRVNIQKNNFYHSPLTQQKPIRADLFVICSDPPWKWCYCATVAPLPRGCSSYCPCLRPCVWGCTFPQEIGHEPDVVSVAEAEEYLESCLALTSAPRFLLEAFADSGKYYQVLEECHN